MQAGQKHTQCYVQRRMLGGETMDTCSLTVAVTALANAIAKGLSPEEAALVGSLFIQLGDTLQTIVARDALCRK